MKCVFILLSKAKLANLKRAKTSINVSALKVSSKISYHYNSRFSPLNHSLPSSSPKNKCVYNDLEWLEMHFKHNFEKVEIRSDTEIGII